MPKLKMRGIRYEWVGSTLIIEKPHFYTSHQMRGFEYTSSLTQPQLHSAIATLNCSQTQPQQLNLALNVCHFTWISLEFNLKREQD